jgi:hypothetical protein
VSRKPLFRTLATTPPALSQVTISIPAYSPNAIVVAYQTLPANTPQKNKNYVAVWESTMIPWTEAPIATATIPSDSQMGSVPITNLAVQQRAYIVGYAVGPKINDMCASATLFVGGQTGPTESCSIGLTYVSDDTLLIQYQTLDGYQPQTQNNWLGLYAGVISPYYATPTLATLDIPSNTSQGNVSMSNLGLSIQSPYTLVYYMGATNAEAAAILTFRTGP